ncbi:MAG: choice-of-anchor Q domain-containing protein, partial [Solirubrobacterales bacterium]
MSRYARGRLTVVGTAAGIGATVAMVPSAQAADLTVTSTADSGAGSLREAINTANLTPATGDRILFQSGLSGAITLAGDLPRLAGPTEINGPGMDQLKIEGSKQFSIFASLKDTSVSGLTLANGSYVHGGNIIVIGADLTVDRTRIEGGFATFKPGNPITIHRGGGIFFEDGNLEIRDSQFSGNEAEWGGGLYALDAKVTISGTSFTGNKAFRENERETHGGGAFLDLAPGGQSTITGSTFSGNIAREAGGVEAQGGSLSIASSLFSGNTGEDTLGALSLGKLGGSGSYGISNSTFTGNATGGYAGNIATFGQNTEIVASTVTDNTAMAGGFGGIVHTAGLLQLSNSIVTGNDMGDIATIPEPGVGGAVGSSFNLIENDQLADVIETVPGSNITSSDPQLGPLADNGGPTMTMLPAETSPVVNVGSSSLPVDQRGLIRPVNFNAIPFSTAPGANGADIGAVELQNTPPPVPPPVPTPSSN